MCTSKDASMALLTQKIKSKKCKKLKVAGKNGVKQEDKRLLVALAHQATHITLAEIMRLSQDLNFECGGDGQKYGPNLDHIVQYISKKTDTLSLERFTVRNQCPDYHVSCAVPLPLIGYGSAVGDINRARGPKLVAALGNFLRYGGRLIDTAESYNNHKDIGIAIAREMENGRSRESIWVQTKIIPRNKQRHVYSALRRMLSDLNINYIESLVIHFSSTPENNRVTWNSLKKAQSEGLVRYIGLDDFDNMDNMSGIDICMNRFHPWIYLKE